MPRLERIAAVTVALFAAATATHSAANPRCDSWSARLVSAQGVVQVQYSDTADWRPTELDQTFCLGDHVRTRDNSRAALELRNDTLLRLDQNTTLLLPEAATEDDFWVDLLDGALHLLSRVKRSLEIRTPFVNAGLEGTEFVVRVLEAQTIVSVLEGRVAVSNALGRLSLTPGQTASASRGTPPVLRLEIRPEDTVHWALYYPLVVDPDQPGADRNVLAAQRELGVGRADRARAQLDALLARDPKNARALALAAIAALVQNATDQAAELAERAVASAPVDSSAQLALSYVRQARFDLPGARAAIDAALAGDPNDALAWARLAELQAAFGETNEAIRTAERAVELKPGLSRTHSVVGFAALSRLDLAQAVDAFDNAITLDPADPLPRVGQALVKIRRGDLAEGRRDLEIAVSLDPSNSLIRSYLGKAYLEEKRYREASVEFQMAKQLDPLDPTPWLYDAVLKQTTNRPVEAAEDLQRSIALNDNRAVYRSSLLLDEDAATRNVSLGSTFRSIGLEQRATALGTRSLAVDPANASAHRLLADAHIGTPRRGIAQVSQLLQAQLFQPLNSRPVAPQSLIRELDNNSGLALRGAGANEYTALFDQEGPRFHAGALAGNHDTGGGEFLVSGLESRLAYSAGYFKYDTDGFRDGADVAQETYNGFFQARVSDALDLQLELRHRRTEQGDLRLRPDPLFTPNERRTLDQDTYRLGAHLRPSAHDHFVASLIWTERDETFRESGVVTQDVDSTREGYSAEAQYIHRWPSANLLVGGGIYRIDVDEFETITIPFFGSFTDSDNYNIDAENLYLYSNLKKPDNVVWTLGLSRENYSDDGLDLEISKWNPKVGVQWQATEDFQLRAVYLKTLKRQLTVDQTLEPTQVAGFNQFFDDFNGTIAELYGIAFDFDVSPDILTSLEFTKRDTEGLAQGELLDERITRGQINWVIDPRWTASLGFFSDDSEVRGPAGRLDLATRIVPLALNFHHPQGFFGHVTASYVEQDVQLGSTPETDEQFGLLDLAIGYRLPKDRGRISLEVNNALDKAFRYLDDGYKTSDPFNVYRPFFPARSIRFSIGLKF